jgi:glycosyltransferase involved in cell wall biosynthesis
MNVLVVHNRYAFAGGEDEACATEIELLRRFGHQVTTYTQDNRTIGRSQRFSAGVRAVWSGQDYRAIRQLIAQHRIELVSVHNFFPLVSPSAYYAAHAASIPVVQTLHNYRLLCPAATFLRDGKICEDCLGKAAPWPAVIHRCYRDSVIQTASVAGMIVSHKVMGTWRKAVDRYIALTPFMREKFIAGGFPAERIVVKPNSVADTGVGSGHADHFFFAGRLTAEKGIHVLLAAWAMTHTRRRLRIAGTGPDEMNLRACTTHLANVEFLGQISGERMRAEIGAAAAVVFPSIWYEGLSRVVTEAFAKGTPVIASALDPISSIVKDGETGVLFGVGDAAGLAAKLDAFPSPGTELARLRAGARMEYESCYADEVVYARLMEIYKAALGDRPRPSV